MEPFGFDDTSFNSTAGVLFNFCGVLGGVVTATILYFHPKHLAEAALVIAVATTATFGYFMLSTNTFDD